jgi:hypothetical protein
LKLQLNANIDSPLLGLVGYDDAGRVVLRGRPDGEGLRAFLMNFVIENAVGQPYYLIRQPTSGVHLHPQFQLLAPDGSHLADLGFGMNRASLDIPGQLPLTAALPVLGWHGYSVEQGSTTLATVSFVGHPLTGTGADLQLRFEVLGSAAPLRRWVIALVSWATLVSPPWKKMTTR